MFPFFQYQEGFVGTTLLIPDHRAPLLTGLGAVSQQLAVLHVSPR